MSMPVINIELFLEQNPGTTVEELSMVYAILGRDNRLRSNKPKVERKLVGKDKYGRDEYRPDELQGKIAYIWRMVAFYVSPNPQHQCMPWGADFDLPTKYILTTGKELRKPLDELVDKIVDTIPVLSQSGTMRWGKALGMI